MISRHTLVAAAALTGVVTCPAAALAQEARVSFRLFPFAAANQTPPLTIEIRGSPSSKGISFPSFTLSKTERGPQLTGFLMALPSLDVGRLTLAPRYGDQRVDLDFFPSALAGMSFDARSMRGLSIATKAGASSWTLMLGQLPTASANLLGSSLPRTLAFTGTIKPRRRVSIVPRVITRLGSPRAGAPQTSLGTGMKLDAGRNVSLITDVGVAREEADNWAHLIAAGAIGRWSRTGFEASIRRGDRSFTLLGGVPFAAEDRELLSGRFLLDRGVTVSGETSSSRPAGTHDSHAGRVSGSVALTVERFRAGRLVVSDEHATDASARQQHLHVEWRHRHKEDIVVRYLQRRHTARSGSHGPATGRFELDVRAAPIRGQRLTAGVRTLMVIAPAEQVPLLTSRVNARFVFRRIRLGSEADITMVQVRRVGAIRALRLTSETPLLRDTSIELSYAYQDGASLPWARRLEARLTRVVRLSRKRE